MIRALTIAVLLLLSFLMNSCASSGSRDEKPAVTIHRLPESHPVTADLRPPREREVTQALRRVFGGALLMDSSANSRFLVGDFNGDDSPDLVVVVRPRAGGLSVVNSELANWIVTDPHKTALPPAGARVARLPSRTSRELVQADEQLVAVIHGFGPAGWRDPNARQAYLLRKVAGQAMSLHPVQPLEFPRNALISHSQAIHETVAGQAGALYWTGFNYRWQLLPKS